MFARLENNTIVQYEKEDLNMIYPKVIAISSDLKDLVDGFIYKNKIFKELNTNTIPKKISFYDDQSQGIHSVDDFENFENVFGFIYVKNGIKYVGKLKKDYQLELIKES